MGRNGWLGRRGGEVSMPGKEEKQGHAEVQSRSGCHYQEAAPSPNR